MIVDPVKFVRYLWPDIVLAKYQMDILYSVQENDETFVPAGNQLGKDYIAGLLVLWFFLSRHPCRIVTTSADGKQLEGVLWGEIRRFIQSSKYPLESERGGPLVVNHLHLRKCDTETKQVDGLSYCIGRVAEKGEGMLGHHIARTSDGIPKTLFVADESSGVDDLSWERSDTWAHRKLAIGNPFPCENFFKYGIKGRPGTEDKGGDILRPNGVGYYRKIIKVKAEESPNVQYALAEIAVGLEPSNAIVVPGVKSYDDYIKHRATWDKAKICVSLDAEFYEGSENQLYPPSWINLAEARAAEHRRSNRHRKAKAIGIDPAEGGDSSCWAVVDEYGLIELLSIKTPNTAIIPNQTLALMRKYSVQPEMVMFDAGGGGKEHADRLREQGYNVRMEAFGAAPSSVDRFKTLRTKTERKEEVETKLIYKNRRAEMYGLLRQLIDPANDPIFGIGAEYVELRRQMAPIPLEYDGEGKLALPPKNKPPKLSDGRESTKRTMFDLIGCSPDELDALVLAIFAMTHQTTRKVAGVAF